jgi:uncharacterized membrane protein YhaH (DUF805 family)
MNAETVDARQRQSKFPAWERWLLASRFKHGDPEFGGLRRFGFFLVMIPFSAAIGRMPMDHSHQDQTFIAILILTPIFCTVPAMLRFRNIGLSMWWSLTASVPIVNALVFIFLCATPEGFALKRKIDVPFVLLTILGCVMTAIGFAQELGTPANSAADSKIQQVASPSSSLPSPPPAFTAPPPSSDPLAMVAPPIRRLAVPAPERTSVPSFEILEYAPFHSIPGEGTRQRHYREVTEQEAAMRKIESFGYYAVSKVAAEKVSELGDGSDNWNLEKGEAFPFLGYLRGLVFLRIGTTYLIASPEMVEIYPAIDHPEAVAKYKEEMAQFAAQNTAVLKQVSRVSENFKTAKAAGRFADVTPIQPVILELNDSLTWNAPATGGAALTLKKGTRLIALGTRNDKYFAARKGGWIYIESQYAIVRPLPEGTADIW